MIWTADDNICDDRKVWLKRFDTRFKVAKSCVRNQQPVTLTLYLFPPILPFLLRSDSQPALASDHQNPKAGFIPVRMGIGWTRRHGPVDRRGGGCSGKEAVAFWAVP